jgi:hypothetical protein
VKICVVYIYPTANAPVYTPMAKRFVQSYMDNPPGDTDHTIHVAVNGGVAHGDWTRAIFEPLPCFFFQHNNYGKDIGAYQAAADVIQCDLMVCLGTPVHFHRPGWLDRIALSYYENGPGVYGCWGFPVPMPHLRTTAFWLPPEFLNSYPVRVGDGDRYGFEHGPNSITLWSRKQGFEPRMVTRDGTYGIDGWQPVSREKSLMVDQHMAP